MKPKIELSTSVPLSRHFKQAIKAGILQTVCLLPKPIWKLVEKTSGSCVISVSIIENHQMIQLNSKYRKKNKTTDVLSFSRLGDLNQYQPCRELGDLVICLSVAKKQAQENQQTLYRELQRLAVHGTLHLFGFDHERSQKDEQKMFRLQDKILKTLSRLHLKS